MKLSYSVIKLSILLLTLSFLFSCASQKPDVAPEVPEDHDAKLEWWKDAAFGMFIHWGPVSLKGTEIGWSRGREIPIEEYDNLYKQFNPVNYDPEEWVATAKAAGMKYIVFTSKHHDGFCNWDTEYTDYNIMNSAYKKDVMKELAAACKKEGMALGIYHSTCDWHHPDFPLTSPGGRVEREEYNLDRYTEYLKNQSVEIIENYGPLLVMWYDVPQRFDATRGQGVIDHIREVQPGILMNNRTGAKGDFDTPEQRVGGFQNDRPWETCMTITNQWAWKPNDEVKSLDQCLHGLIRSAGGDGNFLFNVGPKHDGTIEPLQVERLKEMGHWLKKYGYSIYGTRGGPFKPTDWGVSTRKENKIYLHILNWSGDSPKIILPDIGMEIKKCILADGGKVKYSKQKGKNVIEFDGKHLQPINTIVEIEVAGSVMDIMPMDVLSYQPEWESLKQHENPEWFRDAKLGIYTHWGPVTVGCENCPKSGQWYGGQMYDPQSPVFEFHKKQFGDQSEVGYKDIIPLFKAEKFNAEEWADLFVKAGAKFAGPVAVHHDNFAMWNSKVTPWNSVKMGPKRDITGELEKAIKERGMKFITTFHHGYAWEYYEAAFNYDASYPQYAKLYSEPHEKGALPSRAFLDQWLAMVNETVSMYEPDMIWFDFGLKKIITPEYQKKMFANYYNWAERNNRGSAVALKHPEIHQYTGILDFERGREDELVSHAWLTDTSVGPWFNNKNAPFRSADNLIDVFVDIVSKNGCMLLNVGPAADGTIPDKAKSLLLELGDWLQVNGEAIYGTRPWEKFGEGPTQIKGGEFSEKHDEPFSSKDIRFTTRGEVFYAIALDWPEDGVLKIQSLGDEKDTMAIKSVQLLGHQGELSFSRDHEYLTVIMPALKPCRHAYSIKIQ